MACPAKKKKVITIRNPDLPPSKEIFKRIRNISLDVMSSVKPVKQGEYWSFFKDPKTQKGSDEQVGYIFHFPRIEVGPLSVWWKVNQATTVAFMLDRQNPDEYDEAIVHVEHYDFSNNSFEDEDDREAHKYLNLQECFVIILDLFAQFDEWRNINAEDA